MCQRRGLRIRYVADHRTFSGPFPSKSHRWSKILCLTGGKLLKLETVFLKPSDSFLYASLLELQGRHRFPFLQCEKVLSVARGSERASEWQRAKRAKRGEDLCV